MRTLFSSCFFILVGLIAPSLSVYAEEDEALDLYHARRGLDDRWSVSLGGFLAQYDTDIQVGSSELGPGTKIKLEDVLGLDDEQSLLRLVSHYRLSRKKRFDFGVVIIGRSGQQVLEEEIEFDDTIFEVGALVETDFDTSLFDFAYKYSIVANGKVDFGLSAGLSVFDFFIRLGSDGSVSTPDQKGEQSVAEQEDVVAPVPVLGTHVEVTIRPRLFFRSDVRLFYLSSGDWTARLGDIRATIDWYPSKRFGFGLGWDLEHLEYRNDRKGSFQVDYRFQGVVWYATVAWGGLPKRDRTN